MPRDHLRGCVRNKQRISTLILVKEPNASVCNLGDAAEGRSEILA